MRGVVFGNIIGLGLCYLQDYTGFVKLDESSYYVPAVPIEIVWKDMLLLNSFTLIICSLTLCIPVMLVSRITPVKAIRFS